MHDAEIQKAIDDYLGMELKARSWDALVAAVSAGQRGFGVLLPDGRAAVITAYEVRPCPGPAPASGSR